MLPQEDLEMEIDPDPQLEAEAEETAQRVMEGGELEIQRLARTEVHVQRAGQQTQLGDWDGSQVIEEILDTLAVSGVLAGEDADPEGVRRTLYRLSSTGRLPEERLIQFRSDLQVVLEHDIRHVGAVIADDIADSTINNVDGAFYEFHIAANYLDDVESVTSIGRTDTTVRYDDLTPRQVEQIVEEFVIAAIRNQDPEHGDASREALKEYIEELSDEVINEYIANFNAFPGIGFRSKPDLKSKINEELNSDSAGNDTRKTELDVLTSGGHYLEAKSGSIEIDDIMGKFIRFMAHKLTGKIDPSGEMMVVGREGKFTMSNSKDPLKHTQLINALYSVDWDTFGSSK